ncbi:fatty acid hydroxylase [Epithele typhae]|uniref:fatty acid hydroxylase n=1 Tax=Epithele typhae TaxID=378194 RepID=UPI00200843F3|nr:fatty acid hydroxylase [Epithele typhae]KAH9932778.1 fatty acid hydroxylase [Epithele typhae]
MTTPIPSPPAIPFLGHITAIDKDLPLKSISLLAKQYGELFEINVFGSKRLYANSYALQNELSDEKRFFKKIHPGLEEVRVAAKDGLFTAKVPAEENWYIAHRLLMPCFNTAAVFGMYDDMLDIATQLIQKWERFGPSEKLDPAQDFSRLTLDAISLCAMSYRLNSFYRDEAPEFVTAMGEFLIECGRRSLRPGLVKAAMVNSNAQFMKNVKIMDDVVTAIVEDHRKNPPTKPDLMQTMLTGVDKETGKRLEEEQVKVNCLTFLIAGTSLSRMLTFMCYYLLKNPEAMRKLREEIDTTLAGRPFTIKDINKLPYLLAVMRETLRLSPTAPNRTVAPLENTVIGGKYAVEKDTLLNMNIYTMHRDPAVWGEDAEEFRPERLLGEKFDQLPPNAWQPFGFGLRGCIGRPFAWQEAQLVMVMIMQHFDLVLDDPSYELQIKQTITIKPNHFYIHAIPRKDRPRLSVGQSVPALIGKPAEASPGVATGAANLKPLYVLYGSNTGSSESFAQRLVSAAPSHGFHGSLKPLDLATEHLPTDGPILIVTASFEGQPADNAKHFVEWLENVNAPTGFVGVQFAVFGCGNRDWTVTYQRIPTLIDRVLAEHGATRLAARGEGDASGPEFFDSFDQWEKATWKALGEAYDVTTKTESVGLDIKVSSGSNGRAEVLRQRDMAFGTVVSSKVLTAPGAPPKRHIEFELPEDMTYRAGDYLAILPLNPERVVKRALSRFKLSAEQEVEISSAVPTSLPTSKPIAIFNLLSGYVELQQPATLRDLEILLQAKNSDASTAALKDLVANYASKVFTSRLSVLDILEDNKDIDVSLSTFLQMVPAMRIRQYSISSSPLWNPQHVTLTLSVVDAPARSGRDENFLGVASTYLAGVQPGHKVQMAVRSSNAAFHPPSDPTVPMVMVCAGSGLAPMRGFLQERAEQKKAGREVAPSLLFFGCRRPGEDFLYFDSDLKEWTELGIVDVRPAFSRCISDSYECRYVQDRIAHDKEDVNKAFDAGARFFVCGVGKMSTGVKASMLTLVKERTKTDDAGAQAIFDKVLKGRYATDIFE